MIVDTSVILAIAYDEPTSPWARERMDVDPAEFLRMSWVNIAETGMTYRRDNPLAPEAIEPILLRLGIIPLNLDQEAVRFAIEARGRFPLNFGDCFAYAHARQSGEALITLDDDFLQTDLPTVIHPSRG